MPTPVGHVLGGLAVYLGSTRKPNSREDVTLAAACLFAALAPDLDFAIGPFAGRSYHHYFTHSLGFVAFAFLAAFLLFRRSGRRAPTRDALAVAGAYLSHLALDLVGKDTSPPYGVQLFWPFSEAFYVAPVSVFADIWRGSLALLFGLHNWMAVGLEILILGPVVALLWWRRAQRE